jgi:hypothetical protein
MVPLVSGAPEAMLPCQHAVVEGEPDDLPSDAKLKDQIGKQLYISGF